MKNKLKRLWTRFKLWIVGILAAIGLITVPLVIATPIAFTYTPASQYEDGTPLPLSEIAETRLYCARGGAYQLVTSEPGADGNFEADLAPGDWTCVATHVATNSIESSYSNQVTRSVLPDVGPNPPIME